MTPSSDAGIPRLDLGPQYDPVDLGLVEESDLAALFHQYYIALNPRMPVLDPRHHTLARVRGHSSLLVTAVALAAARSVPQQSALVRRLGSHLTWLRDQVLLQRHCSVELVLGLTLVATWNLAGDAMGSTLWLGVASGMVRELRLDRPDLAPNPKRAVERKAGQRALLGLALWDRNAALLCDQGYVCGDDRLTAIADLWAAGGDGELGDAILLDLLALATEAGRLRTAVETASAEAAIGSLVGGLVASRVDGWKAGARSAAGGRLAYADDAHLALVQEQARLWCYALGLVASRTAEPELVHACQQASMAAADALVNSLGAVQCLPSWVVSSAVHGAIITARGRTSPSVKADAA